MPRVCVVIPCFNGENFVADTLQSLAQQTFSDFEVVVVDDGSTDRTPEILRVASRAEPRMRVITQVNHGLCATRNTGAAQASHDVEFLYFLDHDDVVKPQMLETMVGYLDAHPEADMAYCRIDFINGAGDLVEAAPSYWPWSRLVPTRFGLRTLKDSEPEAPFASFFLVAVALPSMVVMRRSAFEATNGWDASFGQICEDTDMFLRIALQGTVHFVPTSLVQYRRHAAQMTAEPGVLFQRQYEKLMDKWLSMSGLTREQQDTIQHANRFRTTRFIPYRNASAGLHHLRQRELRPAARCLVNAVRSYRP